MTAAAKVSEGKMPGDKMLGDKTPEGKDPADFKNLETEPETGGAKPKPEAKVEEAGRVTGDNLAQILLGESPNILWNRDRVKNRHIPYDAGEVSDFPREHVYKWVPCPSKTRTFMPAEESNLQFFLRNGWQFYKPGRLAHGDNLDHMPWKLTWEPDGDKVRWADQWLMHRPRDYEERLRRENTRRKNDGLAKNAKGHSVATDGSGYDFVSQSSQGQTTVDKVLREGNNVRDPQDEQWVE